jgi:hypothetical protein
MSWLVVQFVYFLFNVYFGFVRCFLRIHTDYV